MNGYYFLQLLFILFVCVTSYRSLCRFSSYRIVNGNFAIPSNDGKYDCFHELIRGTLRVDPDQRFKVSDILERLAAVAETKGFNMKAPLTISYKKIDLSNPGNVIHVMFSATGIQGCVFWKCFNNVQSIKKVLYSHDPYSCNLKESHNPSILVETALDFHFQ